jgi:hypothetical protein
MESRRFRRLGQMIASLSATATGRQLAYVYFEEEPGRGSAAKLLMPGSAAKLLMRDEARKIAVNIAKLPKLLRR